MNYSDIPVEFARWYAREFKIGCENEEKTLELLTNMKVLMPTTHRFFVKKFRDENPNAKLFYTKLVYDGSLMESYVNIPIDPKVFYADIE